MKPFDDQLREQIKFYELVTPPEKVSREELLRLAKACPQEKPCEANEQFQPSKVPLTVNTM